METTLFVQDCTDECNSAEPVLWWTGSTVVLRNEGFPWALLLHSSRDAVTSHLKSCLTLCDRSLLLLTINGLINLLSNIKLTANYFDNRLIGLIMKIIGSHLCHNNTVLTKFRAAIWENIPATKPGQRKGKTESYRVSTPGLTVQIIMKLEKLVTEYKNAMNSGKSMSPLYHDHFYHSCKGVLCLRALLD